jgi:dipeptidyl aminopeptidase/acylaminoacyl peptidase
MTAEALRPPLELLFTAPDHGVPMLSADGSRIAYISGAGGISNIWISDIGGERARAITNFDFPVRTFRWSTDGSYLLVPFDNGNEQSRLFVFDVARNTSWDISIPHARAVRILALSSHYPDFAIVQASTGRTALGDVFKVNFSSGHPEKIAEDDGTVAQWLVDTHLRLRAKITCTKDGQHQLLFHDGASDHWNEALLWDREESFGGGLAFCENDTALLIRTSLGADTTRILSIPLDLSTPPKVIASHPFYDIARVFIAANGEPLAFQVRGARNVWCSLQETFTEELAHLSALEPGDLNFNSCSASDELWTVTYTYDFKPAEFFLWDRSHKSLRSISSFHRGLSQYAFSKMEPISFESRDGIRLHGYLSLPLGGRKPKGLIVFVHGGPWQRDEWGFDPEVQWMTSMDMAALQINFRGSAGYGKRFLSLGNKEWGRAMQDDLDDGVLWAIHEGIGGPDAVGIYGRSYGGYAALMALTRRPCLYRFAIAYAAPVHLPNLLERLPTTGTALQYLTDSRVGHLELDRDSLLAVSPCSHVEAIDAPVLIAHGQLDPRVPLEDTKRFVQQLSARNPYVKLLTLAEGHALDHPDERMKFFSEAERFVRDCVNR